MGSDGVMTVVLVFEEDVQGLIGVQQSARRFTKNNPSMSRKVSGISIVQMI